MSHSVMTLGLRRDATIANIGAMQNPPGPITHGEHLAFLEVLGSMRANDARWTPTMAGFVTVRLVDKWGEALRGWLAPRPSEVAAVRDAIDKVAAGPARNALTAIVDAITQSWGRRRSQVSARLLAYAGLLYDSNEWALAADIYRTFLALTPSEPDARLVMHAWQSIGWCEIWLGRYAEAQTAHETARALASCGDERYLELAAEHGLAMVMFRRGNLPQADARFAAVVAECEKHVAEFPALANVLAVALHDQGNAAVRRGDLDRAFALFARALDESCDQKERDRILSDVAVAFMEMGVLDTARRAFHVVELTTQDATQRWIACLNLMYLATLDGSETVFERYRQAIAREPLPPRLAVSYQINLGEGLRRFGRERQARQAFDRAVVLAERHQLNRELIEAETARDAMPVAKTVKPELADPIELGEATKRVQDRITTMSAELVGAGV
jgi:tetratricopeptide (TPR) repeat protein